METAYHPAFQSRVPFRFEWLPDSPDGQVRATIHRMIHYIRSDAGSALIRDAARQALELGSGDAISGTWQLVKRSMKFQRDDKIAADLETPEGDTRKFETVEVLIRPIDQALLIKMRGMGIEDCDGYEMYAACILTALQVPCSLVTVAADREDPTRFSHVYLAAYPDGFSGRRIPLDFSHGSHIGWECPNLGKKKEWEVPYTRKEGAVTGIVALSVLGILYAGLRLMGKESL